MQKVIFYLGKIVILVAVCVGCSALTTPDETYFNDSPQENHSVVPSQEMGNLSWEDYLRLYSIRESHISKISIEYHYIGWEIIDHSFVIEASGEGYRTADGKTIEKSKVTDLANAMVNLRRSGGEKSCLNHTDDYPQFRVEVEYTSGHKGILYSTSNCNQQRVPWNIVYGDALYFQSTGEIPKALYNLLASFVVDLDKWWQPSLAATTYTGSGAKFYINSHQLPPELKNAQFSEEEIFHRVLIESGELDTYLTNYHLESIDLYCDMFSDCTVIDAEVKLKGQEGTLFIVDAHFDNSAEPQVDHVVTASQLTKIGSDIDKSNLIRHARNVEKDLTITIHCSKQPECKDSLWCATSYSGINKNPPSESLVCSTDFVLGYVASLVYFPDNEQFWVRQLIHDFYESPSSQWKLELDPVLELFQIPGFETITQDIGSRFVVFSDPEKCNQIKLGFEYDKADAIEAKNPGYIDNYTDLLKKNVQTHDVSQFGNTIEILGYCLFANLDGDFSYVQP